MSDIVTESHVFVDCKAATIDEVLSFFAEKTVELGFADDANAIFEAFKAREAEGTTGMTGGFAIPHAKTAAVKEATILVAKLSADVEWPSMDDSPIRCAIALLIPAAEAGTTHLRLLSKIAVMLMDAHKREELLAENDPAKLAALVNEGITEE